MSTETTHPSCNPEMWGGLECTINRVGDVFRDQLHDAGHYTRADDINHFVNLGISKVRYPVLWERHPTGKDGKINWQWITKQLEALRLNNITPIAGLLHHGSGPQGTDLLDEAFPAKLAAYAGSVARQFPWLEYYTPVNEPLTTARFSGLYGFWYPHKSNDRSFVRMLLNQVKGIILSMKAIREINPKAKLVQTEDLSKTHSTAKLGYQAAFENKRRWLTYDLLCGKMDKKHPLWKYFISLGIKESYLNFFLENSCPPDIIGFNYYVTSERYLDHNLQLHPPHTHGGNKRHKYADVEAVRAGHMAGLKSLLEEAWQRYGLPMAITECYLNCTREEQMRWLKEIWDTCCQVSKQGIAVKAVTAWSLLGSYDWDSLLLQYNHHYETGVFDTRSGKPRATLLAKMIRTLASHGNFHHPLLAEPGWWNRSHGNHLCNETAPLLIIGKETRFGEAIGKICVHRAISFKAVSLNDAVMADEETLRAFIAKNNPWGVINASLEKTDGYTLRDENITANTFNSMLAGICNACELPFMCFLPARSARGKMEDQAILAAHPSALVVKTNMFPDYTDTPSFADAILKSLDEEQHAADTAIASQLTDTASTALDFFIDEEKGIWNVNTNGLLTRPDTEERVALNRHSQAAKTIPATDQTPSTPHIVY